MRDEHAPSGYAVGPTLEVGRAFVTFEVAASRSGGGGAPLVCKRTRLAAVEHEDARAQIVREAEILGRLAGRGAPRLVHAGSDERGPFVVMQRVGTETLRSLARDRLATAARMAFAALAAVHEAADETGPLGLVHADLSPANVLFSPAFDRAWIIDFGLARGREWPAPAGGAFAGTIAFAAPELARGEAADARADLFALSAALLSAALGREPRPRGELGLAAQLARAGEQPLDDFARAAPIPVLAACLAFDPGQRPPSARAVLDALATW